MSRKVLTQLGLVALAASFAGASVHADTVSFPASIKLLKPIALTQTGELSFGEVIAGSATTVTTAPDDGNAVAFAAVGEPLRAVTGSIVEDSIVLISGEGSTPQEQITVDSFQTGGSLSEDGSAVFDTEGTLNDLRIGATAHVEAEDVPGNYIATATFRLVYN